LRLREAQTTLDGKFMLANEAGSDLMHETPVARSGNKAESALQGRAAAQSHHAVPI
jgi:hypothetical protein